MCSGITRGRVLNRKLYTPIFLLQGFTKSATIHPHGIFIILRTYRELHFVEYPKDTCAFMCRCLLYTSLSIFQAHSGEKHIPHGAMQGNCLLLYVLLESVCIINSNIFSNVEDRVVSYRKSKETTGYCQEKNLQTKFRREHLTRNEYENANNNGL